MKMSFKRKAILLAASFVSAVTMASYAGAQTVPAVGNPNVAAPTSGKVTPENVFNLILQPPKVAPQVPPAQDGLHDPAIVAAVGLNEPRVALASLTPNPFGNMVDWVQSLRKGQFVPIWSLDPKAPAPEAIDMDIIIPAVGKTADVRYPHKAHTELFDCDACHPSIFVMQAGANREKGLSMVNIVRGQFCGVCHGKVAFPLDDCNRCHTVKK